jgi:hypothetical protein
MRLILWPLPGNAWLLSVLQLRLPTSQGIHIDIEAKINPENFVPLFG